jgi:uncharacterized membrane-anchored protein
MKNPASLLLCGLAWLAPLNALQAQAENDPKVQEMKKLFESLNFRTGEVVLGNNQVKLSLGEQFSFLNQKDSEIVLNKFWGNPPGFTGYGMVFPKDDSIFDSNSWSVVISFEDSGYVSDEDADQIDYEELLADMKSNIKEENEARKAQGYPTLELKGWAEPPQYDKNLHVIYWAKDIRFEKQTQDTLNYNIRVLGRRGVLNLNVVAPMDQLETIRQQRHHIVQLASFLEGHRYADYQPGKDKAAAYGLAALVAGGAVAKKAGFFKLLIAGLLASKKLLVVAGIGLLALLRKLFGKKSKAESEHPTPPVT